MAADEAGWVLVLAQEMDDYDWAEAESRGVLLNARLERAGRQFPVIFFDPERIRSAAAIGTEAGEPYYEPNVIMLPALSRTAVEAAVERLARNGEFDWLLGLPER
ncbi:hypothetical protein GCM10009804_18980 [Kribbella hippodromi]|uniref:Immunity protein 35 domain-containing protein n=1 Tax=Kribbella hippodromi TaxID=434347 RepID=A0ABP4NJG8_9ACTN